MSQIDLFIKKFGLDGSTANNIIELFRKVIQSGRVNEFLNEWKGVYYKIYSNLLKIHINDKKIKENYKLSKSNLEIYLFSIQTYYNILVKLIGLEILKKSREGYQSSSLSSFLSSDLHSNLEKLETAELFENLGILNFSKEKMFSWYIWAWNAQIEKSLYDLIKKLSNFNFNDLFFYRKPDQLQLIYQNLIPQQIRHLLGEFYTPDWLAEYILDKIGFKGDPDQNVLDPSCGSGIFLSLEINKIKNYGNNLEIPKRELLFKILRNVIGFDFNPLVIITAKINYIIAIHDLLNLANKKIEIPIYFYDVIKETPSFPKFDFIIGNPPWINWEDLEKEYRESLIDLWKKYGLFSLKGNEARLGGGKKDISMLFTYLIADKYLKDNGRLGFLITQTVFKTSGAGEGFRRFQIGDKDYLKVLEVIDMVDIRPFKNAYNMTAILILEKGSKTEYPIPYTKFYKIENINNKLTLENLSTYFKKIQLYAEPITKDTSPWLTTSKSLLKLKRLIGPSPYEAYLGLNTGGANGIYWINILKANNNVILIENRPEEGKKNIEKITYEIEKDLVYPLIKSRNLKKWETVGEYNYTIIVQDPQTRQGYEDLKKNFPKTYEYLKKFETILRDRPIFKKYFNNVPFYTMFNIGTYTFSPYKVVWNRMGNKLNASVLKPIILETFGEKVIIPDNVLTFIPFDNEREAHYVCSIMNCNLISFLIQNFSLKGGKSLAPPSILKFLNIPKFNPQNKTHSNLADLSEKAHFVIKEKNINKYNELMQNLNELSYKLYVLTDSEISELKKVRE